MAAALGDCYSRVVADKSNQLAGGDFHQLGRYPLIRLVVGDGCQYHFCWEKVVIGSGQAGLGCSQLTVLLICRRFHHLEWRLQATLATRSLLSQVGETKFRSNFHLTGGAKGGGPTGA